MANIDLACTNHARPTSYDEMNAGAADKGGDRGAVDGVYLDFNKAFDTLLQSLLITKLLTYMLDNWIMR